MFVVIFGLAVGAVVAAHGPPGALGGGDALHFVVGELHQFALGNQVGGGEGAVAVAGGAHFLHRLEILVFVAPQVHHGLLFDGRIGGIRLRLGRGHGHAEIQPRTVARESQRALVADGESALQTGRLAGHQFRGGRLAVPAIDFPFRLFGGGIVAIAQEDHLRLFLVEGQLGILALAVEQRGGRAGQPGRGREDAVLSGIVRRHGIDQLLPVVGEVEFGYVGEGALAAIRQRAQHQIAAKFRARRAACAASTASTAAAAALLIGGRIVAAQGSRALRRIGGGPLGGFLLVSQVAGGLLGQHEAPDALNGRGLTGGQFDDRHAVLGHLLGGLFSDPRRVGVGFRGEGGEDHVLAVRGERDGSGARLRRRSFFGDPGGRLGTRAGGKTRVVPAGQIADHHFAVAFLRKHGVRQKFPVGREVLAGDGAPAVVVLMIQGPFGRLRKR